MNSKDKGNIGESLALAEFIKYGIQVSIPFGDNARYDLVADFNGKLQKIQVKYCNQIESYGSVCCPCASSTNHTTNKHCDTYENDIDYFVFCIVRWNKILLVPIEKIGNAKSIYFRNTPPANGATEYNNVDDYTFNNYFVSLLDADIDDRNKVQTSFCLDCGKEISKGATRCPKCDANLRKEKTRETYGLTRESLKELIRTTSFVKIGEQFGVSDNAVRKWCDGYGLPRKKTDINKYSDQEWELI